MEKQNKFEEIRNLSFSQYMGIESLPQSLKQGEITIQFRTQIYNLLYTAICQDREFSIAQYYIRGRWEEILAHLWTDFFCKTLDEFKNEFDKWAEILKKFIMSVEYNILFDFILTIVRFKYFVSKSDPFLREIENTFNFCMLAYRFLPEHKVIIPRGNQIESNAVLIALEDCCKNKFGGSYNHLKEACNYLSAGKFADCVRESIHSVESVANIIAGTKTKTLGEALKVLESKGYIHGSLQKGFTCIYGYTNDEKGIRHALSDIESNVDITDAQYMLGSCASFVSYLINKWLDIQKTKK